MKDSLIYYSVGALLYCPANNKTIVRSIVNGQFGGKYSLALCLEDTIGDGFVREAEQTLLSSLQQIFQKKEQTGFFLPKIFIRVRCPQQIDALYRQLGDARGIVTGFIIPKFDLDNADDYISAICRINESSSKTIYMMPIFESPAIISLQGRSSILYALKEKLDVIEPYVLNIRVGGNDLCHIFGYRRHSNESIHQIQPISHILSDIITAFGMDYVISGPVWEYYDGENWEKGLAAELDQDRQNGFIGKTVIHPKQIEAVNSAYRASASDYEDAKAILGWEADCRSLVSGSVRKERMNEYKTHYNWAKKTMFLAEYYGVNP